jgi:hypothetical protein
MFSENYDKETQTSMTTGEVQAKNTDVEAF